MEQGNEALPEFKKGDNSPSRTASISKQTDCLEPSANLSRGEAMGNVAPLPSITRAQVLAEYHVANRKKLPARKFQWTSFVRDIFRKMVLGDLTIIEDHPDWRRAVGRFRHDLEKLVRDTKPDTRYQDTKKDELDLSKVFFTFSDWPSLVCAKQVSEEVANQEASIDSSLQDLKAQLPILTRSEVLAQYKMVRQNLPNNNHTIHNLLGSFTKDLLSNMDLGNYQLIKKFENHPDWRRAVKSARRRLEKLLKDDRNSRRGGRDRVRFFDFSSEFFTFSDFPNLVCEKLVCEKSGFLVASQEFEEEDDVSLPSQQEADTIRNIQSSNLPYFTRGLVLKRFVPEPPRLPYLKQLSSFVFELFFDTRSGH